MTPLVGKKLEDLVDLALLNIGEFDRARFHKWLSGQPVKVRGVANLRPPHRLYRVITDEEIPGELCTDDMLVYGIILGYRGGQKGGPVTCAVQVLGVNSGCGSNETPLFVTADSLEDVTDRARARLLRFPGAGKA